MIVDCIKFAFFSASERFFFFFLRFQSLKDSRSGNKHKPCEGVTDPLLDFSSTPPKIKWVFNGSRGNVWSPSASGSLVQESVKQKWSEAFASYIQERS